MEPRCLKISHGSCHFGPGSHAERRAGLLDRIWDVGVSAPFQHQAGKNFTQSFPEAEEEHHVRDYFLAKLQQMIFLPASWGFFVR